MARVGENRRGFTLIDLLVVIMILGILGMITMPQIGAVVSEVKLKAATGETVLALQYARNLAVKYQRTFAVLVRPEDNAFQAIDYRYKDDTLAHTEDDPPVRANGVLFHPLQKHDYVRDFDEMGEYEGVTITSPPGDYYIRFYPDGHSSDTDSTISLGLDEDQRTITVDAVTGNISIN